MQKKHKQTNKKKRNQGTIQGFCVGCRRTRANTWRECALEYIDHFPYASSKQYNGKNTICLTCVKKLLPDVKSKIEKQQRTIHTKAYSERTPGGKERFVRQLRHDMLAKGIAHLGSKEEAEQLLGLAPQLQSTFDKTKERMFVKLGDVLRDMVKTGNTFTQDLLYRITDGTTPSEAAKVLGINRNTVAAAKNLNRKRTSILSMHYMPKTTKVRISKETIDEALRFWDDNTTPLSYRTIKDRPRAKNFEVHAVHWQMRTTTELYNEYKESCSTAVSIGKFIDLRPKYVKRGSFTQGACDICIQGQSVTMKLNRLITEESQLSLKCCNLECAVTFWNSIEAFLPEQDRILLNQVQAKYFTIEALHHAITAQCDELETVREQINVFQSIASNYERHCKIYKSQKKTYQDQLTNLSDDDAIVIMDFAAAWQLGITQVETSNEFYNKSSVHDLVIVVILNDGKNGSDNSRYYFDYLCEKETHDSLFVRQAWYHLLSSVHDLKNRKIHLWSDGGPHHFKIYRTIYLMWQLQVEHNVVIEYNFFASNHGKSICDAHIGTSKQRVRNTALAGNDVVTVEDLKTVLLSLNNTIATDLGAVDRKTPYEIESFNSGIKHYHQFTFDRVKPVVYCRRLSGDHGTSVLFPCYNERSYNIQAKCRDAFCTIRQ